MLKFDEKGGRIATVSQALVIVARVEKTNQSASL